MCIPLLLHMNMFFGATVILPYLLGLWITSTIKLQNWLGSLVVLGIITIWNWTILYVLYLAIKYIIKICAN